MGKKVTAKRVGPVERPAARYFSPEQEIDIGRKFLRGEPVNAIAKQYECDRKTLYKLINERIRPLWREMATRPKDDMMAEIAEVKRVAWKGYQDTFLGITEETVEEALAEAVKGGKVSMGIVKKVTRKLANTTAAAWLGVIQWCLDFEAKVHGHYAPTRSHLQIDGNFRVAGATPNAVNEEMGQRLIERLAASRARAAELKSLGIEGS